MDTSLSPLELLQELKDATHGQITPVDVPVWHGFTFRLNNFNQLNIVVPFIHGLEIVPRGIMRSDTQFQMQPLAYSQKWVKGMVYLRGEIYTVINFTEFTKTSKIDSASPISLSPVSARSRTNCEEASLLLWSATEHKIALLMDTPIQLRAFRHQLTTTGNANATRQLPKLDCQSPPNLVPSPTLAPFLYEQFVEDNQTWAVIDIHSLMNSPKLINISQPFTEFG